MKKNPWIPLALGIALVTPALSNPRSVDSLPQWVGEWTTSAELYMEPGKPPIKATGTERSRMVGKFWLVSEGKSNFMGMPYEIVTTLTYDQSTQKFVATTIDAFSSHQWRYEGTADATGKILTLEGEGPDPSRPSGKARFREIIELKTKDHRVFTTSMQGPDGKWTRIMKVDFKRKK